MVWFANGESGSSVRTKLNTIPNDGTNFGTAGVLGAAVGGTGLSTFAVGDLIYASATTPTLSKLAAVALGAVLVSAGVNTPPEWSATPTLTSLALNGATIGPFKLSVLGTTSLAGDVSVFSNTAAPYIHMHGATTDGGLSSIYTDYTTTEGPLSIGTFSNLSNQILCNIDGTVSFKSSLKMITAAKTLVLKQGANGCVGTFVANGATPVTVSNTNVAINDMITFSLNTVGGVVGAHPTVQTITASTGFTVSATAADTSTYNYTIIKNAA